MEDKELGESINYINIISLVVMVIDKYKPFDFLETPLDELKIDYKKLIDDGLFHRELDNYLDEMKEKREKYKNIKTSLEPYIVILGVCYFIVLIFVWVLLTDYLTTLIGIPDNYAIVDKLLTYLLGGIIAYLLYCFNRILEPSNIIDNIIKKIYEKTLSHDDFIDKYLEERHMEWYKNHKKEIYNQLYQTTI